jgi:hypothetical protein
MNARRTLLILGAVALVLISAVVALAVYFHRQMEIEKNQAKTAKAREARWSRKSEDDAQSTAASEPEPEVTQEPEPVKDDANA